MKLIKTKTLFLFCFLPLLLWSQETSLLGKVEASSDLENIHVLNITSNKFTTTNIVGAFKITAKLNDTIRFTAIKYISKEIIISLKDLSSKRIKVELEELINQLDEVIVGKILTGDLDSDVKNTDEETPVNFYDLGIPGYKGPQKTQNQRRLNEATTGSGIIPLNPIINAISGRTKMLKKRIRDERNNTLIMSIKDRLGEDFFLSYPLQKERQIDFLFFASEDPNFEARCRNISDVKIIIYLEEKLKQYKQNMVSSKE